MKLDPQKTAFLTLDLQKGVFGLVPDSEGVRPQSMGTALGLLEKMGLIERKPHATDGRQINMKLTGRGTTLRRNIKQATYAWLSRAIAELDRQEQITLFKAGELFKRMAEKS